MHKSAKNGRYFWIAIIALIAAAVIATAVFGLGESKPKPKTVVQESACGPYRDDRTVQVNGASFNTEVPTNQTEFDKGLGGRPCILSNQAMLFPFKQPGQYAFWMKDMKFPIDIIWISADHKVVAMEVNEQPSTYPDKFVNEKQRPAQYVLETKANRSKELNINLGTVIYF